MNRTTWAGWYIINLRIAFIRADVTNVVPEPSTLAIAGLSGLIGVVYYLRVRKS